MTSNKWNDNYYNHPYPHPNPKPWLPSFPFYLSPQQDKQQTRQHECIELDLGSGLLWCKFCARLKCPCFKEGGKEKTFSLLEKQTLVNGRVVVDIFDPEQRFIYGMVLLSHVGCVSFSSVDLQHNTVLIPYVEDPDFLEIL